MVKAGIRSLLLAVMLVLSGTGLQFGGSMMNRLVMEHNDGKMPVWMIDQSVALSVLLSRQHCPLTRESRYPLLADIIPQPIMTTEDPDVHLALISLGDAGIFAGGFLLLVGFLVFLTTPFAMFRHRPR